MRVLAVTNIYPSPERPAKGTFIEQQIQGLRAVGVDMDVLFLDREREGMRVYRQAAARVQQRLEEARYDLVHVMYGGVMAERISSKSLGLPLLISFCGSDLLGENCSGWRRKLAGSYGVWSSHRAARRADALILKSRNLERALPPDIDRRKILILPNGVNIERFQPRDKRCCQIQLGWDPGVFHVATASGSDPVKRVHLAEAAVRCFSEDQPKTQWHLLKDVPHKEVPIWLNAIDVLLLTSKQEGSPNIVKEALACNVPVVSVNVGDVAERIEGVEGCYIAKAEPDDLAAKLRLVHDGPRRVEARERIAELSLEAVAGRLKDFYGKILEQWRWQNWPARRSARAEKFAYMPHSSSAAPIETTRRS